MGLWSRLHPQSWVGEPRLLLPEGRAESAVQEVARSGRRVRVACPRRVVDVVAEERACVLLFACVLVLGPG